MSNTWETQFIGRHEEMSKLLAGLEEARKGQGSILFITGEAGIGKTRLVNELAKNKDALDFEFLHGECIYYEGTDPYLPFTDMFKGYLSEHPYLAKALHSSVDSPSITISDVFPIVQPKYSPVKPETEPKDKKQKSSKKGKRSKKGKEQDEEDDESKLTGPYGDVSSTILPNIGSDTPQLFKELNEPQFREGKQRMFEIITKIVINISKRRPVIMFLDDIQWADPASLHLLHYLAKNIQDQDILILGAYRTEELDFTKSTEQPLMELIGRLKTENLLITMELSRLDQRDTNRVVSELLGIKDTPNEFSEMIFKETEGNPFFIKELLRTLIEESALSIKNGRLVMNISPEDIIVPVSIKELIHLRLQRLDEEWVDVLEYASVIGYEFRLELLDNIMDLTEAKLVNILNKLKDAKFIDNIRKDEKLVWQFTHNKIHEVIYNDINDVKKKIIHLRLAKYLEDAKIDKHDEIIYDLAYHFYYGIDFDRALSYSIEGGEKAIRSFANTKALDLFNIALNSMRRLDEKLANTVHYKEKKIEVLMHLGKLHKTMNELDKSLDYFEQIIPICDEINDPTKKAKTYLNMGRIYIKRKYWAEAQNYFGKSLRLAREIREDIIASEACQGFGTVFERKGELDKAIDYYNRSLEFAEPNEDLYSMARAHNAFCRIYTQQGNHTEAVKHVEMTIGIYEQLSDITGLAKAYTNLGLTYLNIGDFTKNIKFNEMCIELADKISDIKIKGYGLSNTVEALIRSEQLDKAFEFASEALNIFRKLEDRDMIARTYVNFGEIFKEKKDWNNSILYFKTAISFMEDNNISNQLVDCYQQFGEMYNAKGESVKANYYLKKADSMKGAISANENILESNLLVLE
jgi:predicted ATPase